MEKEDNRLKKLLSKVEPISDEQAAQDIAVLEHLKTSKVISKAVDEAKALVAKHPDPPEQNVFSFLPTTLTRVSPFFPLSKKDKNRTLPPEGLIWENSWGILTMTGPKLSIYDETVLLAILVLLIKNSKAGETLDITRYETTKYELCTVMGVSTGGNSYLALWSSLVRMTKAHIEIEVWKPKSKKKIRIIQMANTILSGVSINEETKKLVIEVNSFFLEMYAQNFVTGINLKLRSNLKGDISKALYRFLRSQQGMSYECHLLTLCKAINLDVTRPLKTLKNQIKTALTELKKHHYLSKSMVTKYDIVKIWKYKK